MPNCFVFLRISKMRHILTTSNLDNLSKAHIILIFENSCTFPGQEGRETSAEGKAEGKVADKAGKADRVGKADKAGNKADKADA